MKRETTARMMLVRIPLVCLALGVSPAALSVGSWTAKAPMNNDRVALVAAAIDGRIYAMGGSGSAGKTASEVYNPVTDTWSNLTPTPSGRALASGGVIDGKLYVVGGCPSIQIASPASPACWKSTIRLPTPGLRGRRCPLRATVQPQASLAGSCTWPAACVNAVPARHWTRSRFTIPSVTLGLRRHPCRRRALLSRGRWWMGSSM